MLIHCQEEHKLIEKKTVCSTERERENYTREREGERIRMECEKEWGASSRRGHTLRFCDGTRVVF